MDNVVRRIVPLLVALALILSLAPGSSSAADPLTPVRFSLNPHYIDYSALFDAIDKGYFKDAGIDLQLSKYQTSASAEIPKLARGDLDMTIVVAGPALFNQLKEGFDIKVVASLSEAHAGYLDGAVLMVRKDLWDAGTIRKLNDLAGKNIDGAFQGSPIALLTLRTISKAGLKLSDVHYSAKEATVVDQTVALLNKAVDVQGTTEPTATAMVQKGIAVKWLSTRDTVPGYQGGYLATTGAFASAHPDVVARFLQAFLRGSADIMNQRGKITPEYTAMVSKWTEIPADMIRATGSTTYYGQMGSINVDALEEIQKFWQSSGLLQELVPIDRIVDTKILAAAKRLPPIK